MHAQQVSHRPLGRQGRAQEQHIPVIEGDVRATRLILRQRQPEGLCGHSRKIRLGRQLDRQMLSAQDLDHFPTGDRPVFGLIEAPRFRPLIQPVAAARFPTRRIPD